MEWGNVGLIQIYLNLLNEMKIQLKTTVLLLMGMMEPQILGLRTHRKTKNATGSGVCKKNSSGSLTNGETFQEHAAEEDPASPRIRAAAQKIIEMCEQRYRGVQQPAGAVANARLYTPGGTGGAGDQIDPQYPTFGLIR